MNKKLSSALLFGALLMASTSVFVSCKDYDDDVKDLQTQINNLTSAVGQKETTINTSIVNLRTAITALEAMEEAYKKADAAVLAEAKDAVAKAEAALKAAYESGDAATLNAAKAALAEAEAALKTAYQNADAEVLAAAQKAVNDAKAALQGEMSAADAATLASALQAVSDAKTSLQSEMAAADANTLAAAKEAVNQAKAALEAAINANYETLVAKDAELSAAILSAQTAVDQAMTLLGSKADKTELASVNNELQNTIQSLNTLNSTVSGAVTDIKSLQTALAAQEAALNAQKAELQNQIDAQSAALGQTNEKMAAALEQINTLQTTLAEKEAALRQAIADEAARISAELNNMGVSIEELRAAHETFTLKEETAIIRTDVAKIQQDTEALAMSIDEIDAKLDMLSKLLAQNLRSLVYMPKLYMDGIETIEYPWLTDTILMKQTIANYVRTADGKTIKNVQDWVNTIPVREFIVSPVWSVDYHMNPSISATKPEDVKGFYAYTVETITRAGKNNAVSLGITSPTKNLDNTDVWSSSNGILTTGLKIDESKVKGIKNEKDGRENVIVALQVESRTSADKDTLITSDYAMIYPEKTWVEGLVWTKTGLNIGSPINSDEACTLNAADVRHVFDNPVEALEDIKTNADVQLMYNNRAGINLSEYLGLHYVIEGITKSAKAKRPGTWKFGEQTKWGLYYYFDLVDYEVDGNNTHDSKYLKIDATTGNIVAQNVDDKGNILDVESATSVGREPLVRVRVYYADAPQTFANAAAAETYLANHTVVDGYILVHITKTAPTPDPAQQLIIRDFFNKDENYEFPFDLCNGDKIWDNDWAEFSYFVLTKNLKNMTKEQFDDQYEPDFSDPANNKLAIFKKSSTGFTTTGAYGDAIYLPNTDTQTNHVFELNLSNTEMEQLTQHQTPWNNVVRDSLFIRYKGKAGAQYEYIYIKMPVTIKRIQGPESTLKNKNAEYWYKIDGTDNGWDAIIFNVNQPVDGRNTTVFNRSIKSTFLGPNKVTFNGSALTAYKFFFAPIETVVTDEVTGQKYTITPQKNASDANYNRFICKYHVDGTTVHKWGTAAQNKEIMQQCAIAYNEGVFTNKELYAKKNGVYTKIADMNQVTGEINLIQNAVAKEVLNAIGYKENNANVNTELRTYVAVVGTDNTIFCSDLAAYVYEQSDDKSEAFLVSWARPINMHPTVDAPVADATTNGQTVYVLELLKFYDFRGPVAGDMEGANKWMWAYYNIKSLKIDARLDQVETNMGQANGAPVKLSTVTNDLKFGILTGTNSYSNSVFTCDFATILPGYRNNYNAASKSADLLADMGLDPVDRAKQAPFGVLYYENMGDKVTQFDVWVPITVEYEWGSFTTKLKIHIDRTLGN